jgi:hypothetical protein
MASFAPFVYAMAATPLRERLLDPVQRRMADFHLSIGSTGFGAAGVAFGATGSACFSGAAGPAGSSTNRLKQISLSSSSFKSGNR